jgi:hypothetical protein
VSGRVTDHVDHVAAQFIGLHIHRRGVRGDVDLGHHVEQEGLLHVAVRDQIIEKILQRRVERSGRAWSVVADGSIVMSEGGGKDREQTEENHTT